MSRVSFIPPALPKLRASPSTGEGWSYEVKLDGFRVQLHKVGLAATLLGKNGGDLTSRFPTIVAAVITLPVRSCIIDAELIAAGKHGEPDFLAPPHGRHVPVCVYAFRSGWIKVKTDEWKSANKYRAKLFNTPTQA